MTILPEIVLSSGDRVSVRAVSGTVTDDQQSSVTRFYSVGGGGYVGPHGGRVDAPQMRSSTAKQQLIWITDSTGHDTSITLKNVSIPLRVGQQVTAFFCKVGNSVERCDYFRIKAPDCTTTSRANSPHRSTSNNDTELGLS